MSWVQPKRFNWLPRQSAWQQTQNWRARHDKYQAQAESAVSGWSSSFTAAMTDLSYGIAKIVAQKATLRIQGEIAAVSRSASSRFAGVDIEA